MTSKLKVGVVGSAGRMGRTVCEAVSSDPGLELIACLDKKAAEGNDIYAGLAKSDISDFAGSGMAVAVDFTEIAAARENLKVLAENGIHAVVGTTGFEESDVNFLNDIFKKSNCIIASNFAISAVLMMRFSEIAAPFFESAEIFEMHHENKLDAPSGTAMETLKKIEEASGDWAADPTQNEVLPSARGAKGSKGVRVHSTRLKGLVAHQKVMFGTSGQSLTISQDSYDRSSFMPGVILAVKNVSDRPGVTIGLEPLLDIK